MLSNSMAKIFGYAATFLMLGFAADAYAVLPIQHWQTAKGTQVYFVENHDIPMLDVSVVFAAGSSYDTPEKSGLAELTQGLLNLGAGGLSDNEIAKKISEVGASLSGGFDLDMSSVGVRTLSSKREREQALDMLALVLQSPDFPEAVLAREKARLIAGLKEAETQPEAIAEKAFYRAVYGSNPYGLPPDGEIDTVSKLTRDDLVAFYRAHYNPNDAVVAIVGDTTRAGAEAIVAKLTNGLPENAGPHNPLPEVKPLDKAIEKRIPHPAEQSHILIGQPGMSRTDPDYFPLLVGNYVLGGGGFDSRILQEVREKRGLAYSAYSYFMPMKQPGPFMLGLQTKKAQADEAIKVVRETLSKFVETGPTPAELKQAKANLIGGFPLRIDSNRKILEYLKVIGFYGLPLTYLDDFTKNVNHVTLSDIRKAFAKHLDLQHMVTIVVGAPDASSPSK